MEQIDTVDKIDNHQRTSYVTFIHMDKIYLTKTTHFSNLFILVLFLSMTPILEFTSLKEERPKFLRKNDKTTGNVYTNLRVPNISELIFTQDKTG